MKAMRQLGPKMFKDGVALAVLCSLAVAAAPVVWHLLGDASTAPRASVATVAEVTAAPAPEGGQLSLAPILALNPFGAPPAPEPAATQETALNLVLQGVAVSHVPERSFALIADEGRSGSYRPGDRINARAMLKKVLASHVVLDVEGREEILSFPNSVVAGEGGVQSAPDGLERLRSALVSAPPPILLDEGERKLETTQDYIDMWRDRINRNPGEVLDAIGLIESDEGYIIAEEHDRGVALAGLKPGDLVTTVNGRSVGNVEQDREFFDDIAASGQARIELRRNGENIVMSFPLQ